MKFGNLTVIDMCEDNGRQSVTWECRCDCGKVVNRAVKYLLDGRARSCGCKRRDQYGAKNVQYKHGKFGTRIHKIWDGMIQRCHNSNCKDYKNWGGRGIKVCNEWREFENFYADMGEAPEGRSIDRIDNDKGYSKSNCRWATWKEQLRNRRNVRMLSIDGMTKPVVQWAEELGFNRQATVRRITARILANRAAINMEMDRL